MPENLEELKRAIHADYAYFHNMEFTHLAEKFKRDYDLVCQLEEQIKKQTNDAPSVICL